MTATVSASITPTALAERLASGEAITVLDVRDDAPDGVEAPTATTHQISSATVLADPEAVASRLPEPVAVLCNRGIKAHPVAGALRATGIDARAVDGGMRGWLGVLQARPVELGLPRAVVTQVQRP